MVMDLPLPRVIVFCEPVRTSSSVTFEYNTLTVCLFDTAWYVFGCFQATDHAVTLSWRNFMEEVVEQRAWDQEAAVALLLAAPVTHHSAAALLSFQPPITPTLLCGHLSPVLFPISFWRRMRRSRRPMWTRESPSLRAQKPQSKQLLAPPPWTFWRLSTLRDLQQLGLQLSRAWPRSWENVCHGHTYTCRAPPGRGALVVTQMHPGRAAAPGPCQQDRAPLTDRWWRTGLQLSHCQHAQTMRSQSMSSSSKFLPLWVKLW